MQARAVVTAVAGASGTTLTSLRSDPPLLLRQTGPAQIHLLGGAAGPLGGDRLHYDIEVGADASLTIRSVAASILLPGPSASELTATVKVGTNATLIWEPEPTISVRGSCHRVRTLVTLAPNARLRWRESLSLGRSGEAPGRYDGLLRVERDGVVLSHHQLRFGDGIPGWAGPGALGPGRAIASEITVGPPAHNGVERGEGADAAAASTIADDAQITQAVAATVDRALGLLDSLAVS